MDFIRAAIKGLFYDFPLETAGYMVSSSNYSRLAERLGEILMWKEKSFTSSEIDILVDMLNKNWMIYSSGKEKFDYDQESRLFLPLNHFSSEVLEDCNGSPRVKFDNILRWHELTQYIGEDLFITSFLAERDVYRQYDRNNFLWPDVIRHNNYQLNRILDEGLYDLHAHLYATSDIFGINWISIMNKIQKDIFRSEPYQEYDIHLHEQVHTLPLHLWGVVAAQIRVMIYGLVTTNKAINDVDLLLAMSSEQSCIDIINTLNAYINQYKDHALRLPNGEIFDYAISSDIKSKLEYENLKSPYMIHYGERSLLYRYFHMYYSRNINAIYATPWVYLYLLIKVKFRREFIKTNPLLGLSNFQRYEHRKRSFVGCRNDIVNKYAIQSSIGQNGMNHLEARVSPDAVDKLRFPKALEMLSEKPQLSLFDSIFLGTSYISSKYNNKLSLLIHFIKQPETDIQAGSVRYSKTRKKIDSDMKKVLDCIHNNKIASQKGLPLLCGIDAAGNELYCRPEVFAPSFRYAKAEGIKYFTYHAGEDYYDLIDGIRAIDELILFMEYSHGCRIGHALALGVNPLNYYESRHYNVIMPKQVFLDNLVWMTHKSRIYDHILQPSTIEFVKCTTLLLYKEIGYGEDFDEYSYWQSMLLRGDRPQRGDPDNVVMNTTLRLSSLCRSNECEEARNNKKACKLYDLYLYDIDVRKKGNEPCSYHLPKTIHRDVFVLQEAMLSDIEHKGICIECNPSSNLQIGYFNRYDELPLFRFMSIDPTEKSHSLQISINTDDRGVFATSLVNEYSLIAASLYKQVGEGSRPKYSADEINQYLKRIIDHSKYMRFIEE